MRYLKSRILCGVLLLMLMVMIESCAGCSHRSRRGRERQRDRTERRERPRDRREGRGHRNQDYEESRMQTEYTEEYLSNVAKGDDYDEMLDCLFAQSEEVKQLKNEYFRGNLADKDAKSKMEEIGERYQPVVDALEKANNDGDLNYNQHKRQMKLISEYINEMRQIAGRLGDDMDVSGFDFL